MKVAETDLYEDEYLKVGFINFRHLVADVGILL